METAHCPHLASADGPYPDWRATHRLLATPITPTDDPPPPSYLMFVRLADEPMLFGLAEPDYLDGGLRGRVLWTLLPDGTLHHNGEPWSGAFEAFGHDATVAGAAWAAAKWDAGEGPGWAWDERAARARLAAIGRRDAIPAAGAARDEWLHAMVCAARDRWRDIERAARGEAAQP